MTTQPILRVIHGGADCTSSASIQTILRSIREKVMASRTLLENIDNRPAISLRALDWALVNTLEAVGEAGAALEIVGLMNVLDGNDIEIRNPPSPRALLHQYRRSELDRLGSPIKTQSR